MPRLPSDAFERFLALGPSRSYSKLATALGVSKRSITARAGKEGWQERLAHIEDESRRKTETKAVEDGAAMDERHLRICRAMEMRAVQALQAMPITSAAAAVKTIETAVRLQRLITGKEKAAPGPSWVEIVAESWANRDEEAKPATTKPPEPPPAPPAVPPALLPRLWEN